MSWFRVVPAHEHTVMPWANGGGATRQVAIDPPDGSLAKGFRWRVSRARVTSDGPFSLLPGVDRSLWLVSGAGMRLDVAGTEVVLARSLQRFDFAGEAVVHATLRDGPCEDFNVMVARDQVVADALVHEWTAAAALRIEVTEQRLLVLLSGRVAGRCAGADGAFELGAGDAVLLQQLDTVELDAGPGVCFDIAFRRRTAAP